ncbi:MAG: antitoxin [Chloroflexi bacterium RBG_16_54_18]|nr:MAG: antitoxin [Chloroflexi bacterium RBG_16_54_18]
MKWNERIIIDPDILLGKPIIKGSRLSVEFIIDLMAQGWSETDLLQNYPGLSHEDVQACLAYASMTLKLEKVYPFNTSGRQ